MNVLLLFLFLQEFVNIPRTPYTIRKRKIFIQSRGGAVETETRRIN
jgi:hypothetical protein